MSATVTLEIPEHLSARRPSSRQQLYSARNKRPQSAGRPMPVKHEPCSSTLGKFHDSVNHSLMLDSSFVKKSPRPNVNHPVLDAKEKYKYMTRTKSYVDESLFGSFTPRQNRQDINQYLGNHLTHDLMSNMAPLIHTPGLSRPSSARSVIDSQNTESNKVVTQKPPTPAPKPWKP